MLRILITSGGSREPIDEVRYISNVSTGSTGAALADALADRGHFVTLLRGQGSVPSSQRCINELFSSAADLQTRLASHLGTGCYDAVIMCAAVADYRPDTFVAGKIRSDADRLVLRLVRNPKLLPGLKAASPSPLVVIGFKLTVDATPGLRAAAVQAQFHAGGVDAVVHNDLGEIRSSTVHPFHLFRSPGCLERLHGTSALARTLAALIEVRRGHSGTKE